MRHEFELTVLVIFCASAAAALRMMWAHERRLNARWPVPAVGVATFLCAYLLLSALFFTLGHFGLNPIGPVFDRLMDMVS